MKPDKSQLFMDFMMRPLENTEMPTLGNTALKFLITLELLLLLREKYFVSMQVYRLK
jgi:hypothetical protein